MHVTAAIPQDQVRPCLEHRGRDGETVEALANAREAPIVVCAGVRHGYKQPMTAYTKKNLRSDVEDQAPKFGMPGEMQARFARTPLDGKTLGLSLFTLAPGFRIPF